MADEQSTSTEEVSTSVDTSVDVEDTSVADNEDVDLEDIEVTPEELGDDTPETEESETEEKVANTDDPGEDESESDDTEETELSDEDKQKQANNEMAQKRIQEKEARIARVKDAQTAYVAEAKQNDDPLDAAVRQLQVDAYNNTVERVSNTVTNQYQRAITDFPVLNTQDPVIQAEIDDAIDSFQARHVKIDNFGNPTEVSGDLYVTLQAKADSIEKLTGIKAAQQEKSKSREKSKTLTTPGRPPKEAKVDPDMAAFDEEAKK